MFNIRSGSHISHTLFDVGEVRVAPALPKPLVSAIADGALIRELL